MIDYDTSETQYIDRDCAMLKSQCHNFAVFTFFVRSLSSELVSLSEGI